MFIIVGKYLGTSGKRVQLRTKSRGVGQGKKINLTPKAAVSGSSVHWSSRTTVLELSFELLKKVHFKLLLCAS